MELLILVSLAFAIWTYFDARNLDRHGPLGDAALVLLLLPFALPWYIATRKHEDRDRCPECRARLHGADECRKCGAVIEYDEVA